MFSTTSPTLKFLALSLALTAVPALADEDKPEQQGSGGSALRRSGALLDRGTHQRPWMLSVFAGVPYGYFYYAGFPFGIGGRLYAPIAHDGFVPPVNDEFGIEFGVDFSGVAGSRLYPVFAIPVEVMWQFHLLKEFSLYVKAGIALQFNVVSYCPYAYARSCGVVTADGIGNVGLIWHFTQKIALRVEAGYPWLKLGLGFDL